MGGGIISDGLRVRIKFMGQYGRTPLATAGLLVCCVLEAVKLALLAQYVAGRERCQQSIYLPL